MESSNNNDLHRAFLSLDNEKVATLVSSPNKATLLLEVSLGNTPLLLAFKTANKQAALEMIGVINDSELMNKKDGAGMTALHWAAFYRLDDVIKALVKKGADIHIINKQGQKPLELYKFRIEELNYESTNRYDKKIIAESWQTKLCEPFTGATDILYHMDKVAHHYLKLSKLEAIFSTRNILSSHIKFRGYFDAFHKQFIVKRNQLYSNSIEALLQA